MQSPPFPRYLFPLSWLNTKIILRCTVRKTSKSALHSQHRCECESLWRSFVATRPRGNANIVSTPSRVLIATEQRYTTCEQELLGMIFALEKFRIYIYGHKIIFYTFDFPQQVCYHFESSCKVDGKPSAVRHRVMACKRDPQPFGRHNQPKSSRS